MTFAILAQPRPNWNPNHENFVRERVKKMRADSHFSSEAIEHFQFQWQAAMRRDSQIAWNHQPQRNYEYGQLFVSKARIVRSNWIASQNNAKIIKRPTIARQVKASVTHATLISESAFVRLPLCIQSAGLGAWIRKSKSIAAVCEPQSQRS